MSANRKVINAFREDINEMARVGFIPIGSENTIEVYVHTNDAGKVPHFHVRKYGRNNSFEWETCIKLEKAEYFLHGRYKDKLPNRKTAKALHDMLSSEYGKPGFSGTYWHFAIAMWNANNSSVEIEVNDDSKQPDYSKL